MSSVLLCKELRSLPSLYDDRNTVDWNIENKLSTHSSIQVFWQFNPFPVTDILSFASDKAKTMNVMYVIVTGGEKNIRLDRDSNPGPQEHRPCTLPLSYWTTWLFPSWYITKYLYPTTYHLQILNSVPNSGASTGETQESMNSVSCRRDMTEILLKAAYNTIQSTKFWRQRKIVRCSRGAEAVANHNVGCPTEATKCNRWWKKISGSTAIRTQGLRNTVPALFHWATKPHACLPHDILPNTCTRLHNNCWVRFMGMRRLWCCFHIWTFIVHLTLLWNPLLQKMGGQPFTTQSRLLITFGKHCGKRRKCW